jgi:DNA polymerase-3 subunit alpha
MGHKGVAITDHESISAHVKAIQTVTNLKEKGKISEDFKLILGNEIYLVESTEDSKNNYKSGVTKFPHFLLLAKDEIGHEQIRYMSSQAWISSFYTGPMLRTPTERRLVESITKRDPGHLIASSACLGSPHCIYLLEMKIHLENNDKNKADESYKKACDFTDWCIGVFGREDFYLELQPAYSDEQIFCNKELLKLAAIYNLKYIITTDSHFLRPDDRVVHRAFLNAKDAEREVDSFYEATFVQTKEEITERLSYLDHDVIKIALDNTMEIGNKIEEYTLLKPTIIPKIELPEFELRGLFKSIYDKYEYINKMAHSDNSQDRYIVKLIEDGFYELLPYNTYSKEKLHQVAARIDIELGELWKTSQVVNQSVASYYITVREIVNVIWDDECGDSLVGPSRGSSAGWIVCFLMGITQINPLEYGIEMPHWRHLTAERPEFPDIDIDTEAAKRGQIFRQLKKHFGEDRVLQVCTFGTEASKSAVQSAARGLGIDNDTAMHISGLIPFERGSNWTLSDCVNGNEEKERKPVQEFIDGINKHENWLNVSMKIEGLVNKRSIHASGAILFNEEYYKTNAIMTAPNGTHVTQFSLEDCEAVSNMKFDLLTIEGLDKIRVALDMLLEDNLIEWQGTIRKTYNKYLHPTVIDIKSPHVYDLIGSDSITDLFQFSTEIGIQTVKRTKPANLIELASANSLMRLMGGGHGMETPIDSFIRFKNDISLWYEEMHKHNLSDEEIKVLEKHLLSLNGVADTQESIMLLSMDKAIAGFSIQEANKLRKIIAKKKAEEIEEIKAKFYKKGLELGNRVEMLDYVWNVQIVRQLGYSFSILHTLAYSVIALQEANLNINYDPIYWRTACLTVNSASIDDEDEDSKSQSTNYGKIASAIGSMQSHGVKIGLPNINKAHFGFKPDLVEDQIIFGLKGINGIGDDVVQHIIQNRPYTSFDDFLVRMYDTSIIKKAQLIQLIKAGCFETFGDRISVMKTFVNKLYIPKEKLNLQNLNAVIECGLIPQEMQQYSKLFNFRKYVMKKIHRKVDKDKYYALDKISTPFYYENFSDQGIKEYSGNFPVISENVFKKEYDKKMDGIREWLSLPETLEQFNTKQYEMEWESVAEGTVSKWEMDSLSFYYTEHELEHIDYTRYGISKFGDLPEEPIVASTMTFRNGNSRPKFKLDFITGTVLDKDKNKHTVALLTTDGVVTLKFSDGEFAYYNKQVSKPKPDGGKQIVEKTWFARGNKLVLCGYRRGAQFKPHRYKDTNVKHTTMLITAIGKDGSIKVETERKKIN